MKFTYLDPHSFTQQPLEYPDDTKPEDFIANDRMLHSMIENLRANLWPETDRSALALKIIQTGIADKVGVLVSHFDAFGDLDKKAMAREMIQNGMGEMVLRRIEEFGELDQGIALLLIDHGLTARMLRHWNMFTDMDPSVVFERIIAQGDASFLVLGHLEKFPEVNHNELVHRILEEQAGEFAIREALPKLQGLDTEIAALMGASNPRDTLTNLQSFDELDTKAFVSTIIAHRSPYENSELEGKGYIQLQNVLLNVSAWYEDLKKGLEHLGKSGQMDIDGLLREADVRQGLEERKITEKITQVLKEDQRKGVDSYWNSL